MITAFESRVYECCKMVPKGKVTTYKAIAQALGHQGYRAVGNALNKNPFSHVPCHRVVCANGRVGGFAHGVGKKVEMLRKEGVEVNNGTIVDFERRYFHLYGPSDSASFSLVPLLTSSIAMIFSRVMPYSYFTR